MHVQRFCEKFSNLHIVVSRYVAGVITVNSLIYDIPCIISRDFMHREHRLSRQKISPFANETR